MNWQPSPNINGNITARNNRFMSSVVLRYLRQSRSTGKYSARVNLETGFSDSGRSLPLMKITISTGTRVIASNEGKRPASVFCQATCGNRRPPDPPQTHPDSNSPTLTLTQHNTHH